jgi:hypothetical protein
MKLRYGPLSPFQLGQAVWYPREVTINNDAAGGDTVDLTWSAALGKSWGRDGLTYDARWAAAVKGFVT